MVEPVDIAALKAAGMSDADIASLAAFDLGTYQKNFQANTGAYESAKAAGLTAAQATGLSDRYVAYNDPAYGDIVPGTNAQVLGNLGMMPSVIEYTPVFNIKGDQGYEDYDFAPIPGTTYRLLDNNTGKVIATATNATEAKGLAQAANAISEQMGGNANWAIQEKGSFSDGKGNMTTGFSDVYTNEKTGTMNDLKGLIQAAGVMAAVGGGIAALSASAAGGAGAGAASAAGAAEAGSLAPGALASTASNVAAINTAAQATAASAGLSSASANLLSQVGMGAVRGGITSAALGQDPIKGAITGGFGALGASTLGPVIQSVKGAGEVATNLGASIGTGIGTTFGGVATGNSIQNSFLSGVATGVAQFAATEIGDAIADARARAASEARSVIQDQILEIQDALDNPASLSGASLDFAKSAFDEIVVNAAKEYGSEVGDWAAKQVAATIAGLTSGSTSGGSKAETETAPSGAVNDRLSDTDPTGEIRAGLASDVEKIASDLQVTGNSAAGITAANNALNALLVTAQNSLGDRGSSFVRDLATNVIGGIGGLTVTGTSSNTSADANKGIGNLTVTGDANGVGADANKGSAVVVTGTGSNTGADTKGPPGSIVVTGGEATTPPPGPPKGPPGTIVVTGGTTTTPPPPPNGPPTILVDAPPTSPPPPPPPPPPPVPPPSPPEDTPPKDPTKWTTKDWIMLGLAVPNLVNSIVGKGSDTGTITPDKSAVTYTPLNRQRGIGSFDPFTYGQEGPGYQTAEYEFFRPYSAAQPTQTSTPATVNWTPGADVYQYTPEQFEALQSQSSATYAANQAAFKNYQDTLAQNVESGAMTLAQAQAAAQSYAAPFGGTSVQRNADGGYIGYAEGGEMHDDMVKHLLEYKKGGGHNGPGPVKGIGSGQEDKIPAWLSDGEYVWSAQDVADLGDGSTDEGVRRLDKMRQMVRKQAGRKNVKKIAKPQRGIDHMLKAVGGKV